MSKLDELRSRLRQGAFGVGAGGVAIGLGHDLGTGALLLVVGLAALVVDERLTRSSIIPWGER